MDWFWFVIGLLIYWFFFLGGIFLCIVFWNKIFIKLVYIGKEKYRFVFTILYIEVNFKGLIDCILMFSLVEYLYVISCEDKDLV